MSGDDNACATAISPSISSPASGGGLGAGKPKPGGEDTVAP
jgi:hypothetical protein